MIEVVLNDRLGKKIRVKCKCGPVPSGRRRRTRAKATEAVASRRWLACSRAGVRACTLTHVLSYAPPTRHEPHSRCRIRTCSEDDTVGDLKKLVAAQTGTRPDKIRIQKWYTIYKDHITLADYEIQDGMGLELYYN